MRMGLLEVGELPKVTRGPGRRPGKWRGHEDSAEELKRLRSRQKNPEKAWGMVAARENATKAQAIVSAIKKGEAVGFEQTKGGRVRVLYDVWARYVPN
jgi:hypothetical protein